MKNIAKMALNLYILMKSNIKNLNNNIHNDINIMAQKLCEYVCGVDDEVMEKYPSETPQTLRAKLENVLSDPRGWRKYGYEFRCAGFYDKNNKMPPQVMKIILVTWERAKRECGSRLGGFSCYGSDDNTIYINLDNWMGKSASKLPLDRYRTYVINHEMGHRLGFGHPENQKKQFCDANRGAKGSVMIQMTRGPEWVAPCIENEWPLDPEEYDETKNPHLYTKYPISGGASEGFSGITSAITVCGASIFAILSSNLSIFIIAILIIIWIFKSSNNNQYEQMLPYTRILREPKKYHDITHDNSA